MKPILLILTICCTGWILSPVLLAETPYPMLMSLKPVAVQQGSTSEHELESRYTMFGATQVIVSGVGVAGEIVTPMELGKDGKAPALTKLKLRLTVAPDALPGIRDVRIIGPTGPSTVAQVLITPNPVVYEQAKNNTPDLAQSVNLPATLCGAIESAEDVDYFKFRIDQPQTVQFHCVSMRLQDKIHDLQSHVDPIIAIKDAVTGSTIAMANNDFAADPLLSHEFSRPGEYLIEVRDVRYQGNRYWEYAIETSAKPFVAQVFPIGLSTQNAVSEMELVTVGNIASQMATFKPAQKLTPGPQEIQVAIGETLSNPISVVASDLPCLMESADPNNTAATAQNVSIPCGINGRIEAPNDIDCFRFSAKKGDRLTFEVVARRRQSQLDSILRILKEDGSQLTEVDDLRRWNRMNYQDSELEFWSAPADGNYVVEIRDVHLRGGPGYAYFLKIERSLPYFELSIDTDKTWISPGSCCAIFARAVKKNGFQGEIQLHVEGLPAGVIAHCGRILAGAANDGCIILEAPAGAPQAASNIRVYGTATTDHDGKVLALSTDAQPMQEIYMPGGGRSHYPVDMHTVAIGAPGDILGMKLSEYDISLKPGESKKIEVEIQRAPDFATNVTLDMLFQHLSSKFANTLPEGVTIDLKASKTLLTGAETKGHITLKVEKNAPAVEKQQCSVMANVSVNFVMKVTTSSLPLNITVTPQDAPKATASTK